MVKKYPCLLVILLLLASCYAPTSCSVPTAPLEPGEMWAFCDKTMCAGVKIAATSDREVVYSVLWYFTADGLRDWREYDRKATMLKSNINDFKALYHKIEKEEG